MRGIGASDMSSLETVRGSLYVVMEAAEGGTLRDLVTRQMTSRCERGVHVVIKTEWGGRRSHSGACHPVLALR
jgi:hypothetical protein